MNFLFVTQVVDRKNTVLGFVVRWLEEFVIQGVNLTVFARVLNKEDLPPDVRGVEMGQPKIRRILKLWFYSIKYRRDYDAVLVHMTPEILVLGWPVWFMLRKKVYLWYIHPHVSCWLRIALVLCRGVFTATERSIKAVTPKKIVVGHGIETDVFKPGLENKTAPLILYVGRISPVKKLEDIFDLLSKYHSRYPDDQWIFSLVGSYAGHESYFDTLKAQAARSGMADRVNHREPVAHDLLPEVFSAARVTVSATPTGSLDKVVLESLACGTPVMVAGKDYLNLAGAVDLFDERAPDHLHELMSNPRVDREAREDIIKKHDLKRLIRVLIFGLLK